MIRNPVDFFAGLLFLGFGIGAMLVARDYPMGTTIGMGPGYFPTILGGLLVCVGLVLAGRAFWLPGERVATFVFRPLLLVHGAVVAFALLVEPLGLALAILALVPLSRLGGWEVRAAEVAILALVLAALALGIFVYGLGLPFRVWPG